MTTDATSDRGTDGPRLFQAADLDAPVSQVIAGGQAVFYSHRSPLRSTNNQDSAALIPLDGPSSRRSGMLIVADGAGGHAHGDRASALAVTHVAKALHAARTSGHDPHTALLGGIDDANQEIIRQTDHGMTTLLVAELVDDTVRLVHAGDSEGLLIGQRGRIKHSTVPHSPVGYAVRAGLLDEDDAMTHHERHIISNALGMVSLHVELSPVLAVALHDTVLLASDGLFDNLPTREIVEIVRKGPLEPAVARLVELSRSRMRAALAGASAGKPDDLTIVAWRRQL